MYRLYLEAQDGNYEFAPCLASIDTNDGKVQAVFSRVKDPVEFEDLDLAISAAKLIMTASSKIVDVVLVKEVKKLDFEKIW